MPAPASHYAGPEIASWRRFLLRRSRGLAILLGGALAVLWIVGAVAHRPAPQGVAPALFLAFAAMLCAAVWAHRERDRLVREAPLPRFLQRKLRESYPHLGIRDAELVERGLRQFFLACQRSRGRFVAMPSRVADSMWHEFILHTRAYREWCELVVGRFVDHVPAEALGRRAGANDGLRRAWFWACRDESIGPRSPARLPLLFALDARLAIAGGFHYVADCRGLQEDGARGDVYCGESFSDGSYSGDAEGFGGSDSGGRRGRDDGDSADDGASSGFGSGFGSGDSLD